MAFAFGARRRIKSGLDRGRSTHGAKWCFVTPDGDLLDYAPLRAEHADAKTWTKWRQARSDWELFKSKKEAKRWLVLLVLNRNGLIRGLDRQRSLALEVRRPDGLAAVIGHYRVDFVYEERIAGDQWQRVYEETKGYAEDLFLWKRRHFETQFGVQLRIT